MRTYCMIILLFGINFLWGAGAGGGQSGLSFLKIGVDARAAGMGEAYTAAASDASAVFWNPAGLLTAGRSNVLFSHNEWIQDIRAENAALSLARGKSAWAMQVRNLNVGDIQVREIPTENPLEETSAHYLAAGISYARTVHQRLDFGVTIKYLFEKIYVESASGVALDMGVMYRSPVPNLRIGAVVQNLGQMSTFRKVKTTLPLTLRLGSTYRLPFNSEFFSGILAADVVKVREQTIRLHTGTEVTFWKQIAVRGGVLAGYDARNVTFGVGFLRSSIRLDYAIIPFDEDLGVTHRFTINFDI